MILFDKNDLEQHADEFCRREELLSNEMVDLLRAAEVFAPAAAAPRVRQLMNDADRMTRYFAAMKEALYEAGEQVEGTSRAVLERLEDSEAELNRLLQ